MISVAERKISTSFHGMAETAHEVMMTELYDTMPNGPGEYERGIHYDFDDMTDERDVDEWHAWSNVAGLSGNMERNWLIHGIWED
jgi:hypothetical protein